MEGQLLSLSKVFTEKLFRIPDYQRGYAWTEKQLEEFWNDISNLSENQNHYFGVVTVEEVPKSIYNNWNDDLWIIESRSYQPYYIVDGQQRITTTIILIQVILEKTEEEGQLNYTAKNDIRKKFIYEQKSTSDISRSYLFGYEEDNPSYNYLKKIIFNEVITEHALPEDTIYTKNLIDAKQYFLKKLDSKSKSELEKLYKVITQNLLITIYTITKDIDVFIAFETMNNRGKRLSNLELLKNRLIYISTKLKEEECEKSKLRSEINEGWKSIYHYLGKNKDNPLEDDYFLSIHYSIYFDKERLEKNSYLEEPYLFYKRNYYAGYVLLEKIFSLKSLNSKNNDGPSKIEIHEYVNSLKRAVEIWYAINNPKDSKFDNDVIIYLDKINRLDYSPGVQSLILAFFLTNTDKDIILQFLIYLEKRLFIAVFLNIRIYSLSKKDEENFNFLKIAKDLFQKKITSLEITKVLSHNILNEEFVKTWFPQAKRYYQKNGYYQWAGIRYFLFEYEMELQNKSKTKRQKLFWPEFTEQKEDYYTIEHIYPQRPRSDEWVENFKSYSPSEKTILRHSIGNLLPLSQAKNSSFNNKSFKMKKETEGSIVGFKYGSYSEIEVSNYDSWNAYNILERGVKLLEFLEMKWGIQLGSDKKEWLGLKGVDIKKQKKQT